MQDRVQPEHVNVTRREPQGVSYQALPQPARAEASSRVKYVLALVAAAASDAASVGAELFPPLQIAIDIGTALIIWALLGWRWMMLPALIAEAIPGLALFPTWLMVVLAYGAFPKTRSGATPPPVPGSSVHP